MKPSLGAQTAIPSCYVQQLHFQSSISPGVYRSILNDFWRFATKHSRSKPISLKVIRKWLLSRKGSASRFFLYNRARLVERFLDWMVAAKTLPVNPFAVLKKQYGQRKTRPIVRALLSSNPKQALKALTPLPRFGSFLGSTMRDHVALMKSMGYRYKTEEEKLLRFDRFLQGRRDLAGKPLRTLIQEWTNAGSSRSHVVEGQVVGRMLSKALRRLDPRVEAFQRDRRAERLARQSFRRPYIYTEDEMRRLLNAARNLSSPRSPLRPLTLYTMLVLAYCAGLRIGELVRLTVGDIDFRDQTIDIRETKFFKSRRLPLAPSVVSALKHYLVVRQKAGAPTDSSSALFWHRQQPGGYARVTAHILLVRVMTYAGLKHTKGYTGPRVHDLRHAFAVHRLLAWYREGINPQPRLPYLATYLGHKNINSTLVYLTITEEILQHAGERFRVVGAEVLRASRRNA